MPDITFPYFNPETPKQVGDNFRRLSHILKVVGGAASPHAYKVRVFAGGGPWTGADINSTDDIMIFPSWGSVRSFTLPLASSMPGRALTWKLGPSAFDADGLILNRTGADQIEAAGNLTTSLTLDGAKTVSDQSAPGVTLVSDGVSKWYQLASTEPLGQLLSFRSIVQNQIQVTNFGSAAADKMLSSDGSKFVWRQITEYAHDVLSSTHSDTLAAAVQRGDLITGNATPKWSRLAKGAAGTFLRSDGTDPSWQAITDADVPDTITLSNITQITTRSHASLQNLSADDHTQYVMLTGRAGGQVVQGGTAVGDTLNLRPSSAASFTGGMLADFSTGASGASPTSAWQHLYPNPASITTAQQAIIVGNGQTLNIGAAGGIRALIVNPILNVNASPNSTPWFVFSWSPTIHYTAAGSRYGSPEVFRATNVHTLDAASGTQNLGLGDHVEFMALPVYNRAGGSTVVLTAGTHLSHTVVGDGRPNTGPTIDAGWRFDVWQTILSKTPQGTGTIDQYIGHKIEDVAAYPGTMTNVPQSIQSLGATVQMRHAGPVIIGSTGAPNTTKGLDLSGDFATRETAIALSDASTNNDLAIGSTSFVRITGPTTTFTITGMANGFNGKRVILYNTTGATMNITNEDAGSTAANRFTTNTGGTIATTGTGAFEFFYDATASRWVVIGNVL